MSRDEDRDRFSRSGFAPLPNRHEDLPPAPGPYDSLAPEGGAGAGGGAYAGRRSFGASSDGYERERMIRERERDDRIPPPREYPAHAGGGGYGGGRGGGGYERGGPAYGYGGGGGGGGRDRRDSWVGARDGRAPPPWEDDYGMSCLAILKGELKVSGVVTRDVTWIRSGGSGRNRMKEPRCRASLVMWPGSENVAGLAMARRTTA